jgi:ribonuclease P protein component
LLLLKGNILLAKNHRFHGLGSLNYTYRRGIALRGQYYGLKVSKNRQTTYRISVVVSKKVTKSAPKRNRIRRRLYEACRLEADNYLTNQDIIFTVYDEKIINMPFSDLVGSIKKHFAEIKDLRL